ncbi:serine hydrolase domain-containing protein [Altibacter sp. HG106]|uniref:serine hydrolase domain-containing protein n=1 Tax=Altibacter sp. HG106 TaxID=3023937 RepID=UPI00235050AA|nr:serine hydrolase domain-containing protein [Altibacter sp. HG106]MDC7996369.1 serine hydrolase [Altibacter sp. HG106]
MKNILLLISILLIGCTSPNTKKEKLAKDINNQSELRVKKIEENLVPIHFLKDNSNRISISKMMEKDSVPGVSIAFIENGDISWQKTYGYSNLQDSLPVTTKTLFNGASLSKPIAAMAALNLSENGFIGLNEDVNTYLKNWKIPQNKFTEEQKVTLKRLIGHTGGIINYVPQPYSLNENSPNLVQMLSGTKPSVDPPVSVIYVPGEKRKYSNPGYTIIQKMIEDVSDKNFESVIQELIFKPSEMYNSSFEQPLPQNLLKKTATGYSKDLKGYPYKLFPWKAAGGIWTTPTDLSKFTIALLEDYHSSKNNILSKKMADSVFQKKSERLGFGKLFSPEKQDLLFEHWGSSPGFTCYMVASLNKKQGVIIMTNSDNGTILLSYIARAVAQEYNWDFLQPTIFESFKLSVDEILTYVGKFSGGDKEMVFEIYNENLVVSDAKNNKSKLIPVGGKKFILKETNNLYEFLIDKNDKINYVRITNSDGYNNDYRKQ